VSSLFTFSFFAWPFVVTGDGSVENASHDADNVIETHIQSVEQNALKLKSLSQDMDMDWSGTITIGELEEILKDPIALDVDAGELDLASTNEMDLEEFIIGCLQLKVNAR